MNDEFEKLNKEIKKLKREIMINKMEYQTEMEHSQRRQELLNLLIPRTDMEDLVQVLFAYIIRLLPFTRAYINIVKDNYSFSLMVSGGTGKINIEKNDSVKTSIDALVKNVLMNMRGYLINDLTDYDRMLFSEKKTAMIFPVFISDNNSYAVCYFENDTIGSYSNREFEVIEDMLQDIAYTILNTIDLTMLSRYKKQSIFGPITGLYTNNYLKSVLEKQIIISKVTKRPFSLILAKLENKNSGNIDSLVIETANLFKKLTRKVDTVFQLNRNTLALLVNNSNTEVAEIVLNRLQKNFKLGNSLVNYEEFVLFGDYTYDGEGNILNTDIIKKAEDKIKALEV